MDELKQRTILNFGAGGGGWDGENERKLIVMHGKENHNQTTGWCSLEYVLYYKEGKTISIQKYILIVW
jgi:hypothetical protein